MLLAACLAAAGCNPIARIAADWSQDGDPRYGVTYYIGGAGPFGNIGAASVPSGLQDAGYEGYTRIYTWQGLSTPLDQISLGRNRGKSARLAYAIRRQKRRFPNVPISIVALSAGTGIAAFALERLPEDVTVKSVAFVASSLSSRYDLTRALRRVEERLYAFYSPHDVILQQVVPYTKTVDRRSAEYGIAGLIGFQSPMNAGSDTEAQYKKLENIGWRPEFALCGHDGGHTDGVSRAFVSHYIAPLLLPKRPAASEDKSSKPVRSADSDEHRLGR
ncbi:MAG: hypothetical protein V3T70_07040 [Phycisphaerae bacterium]